MRFLVALVLLCSALLVAPGATAATAYTVTAQATPASLMLQQTVRVKGTVTPAAPGSPVTLQRYTSSGWSTVASASVRADGTYTIAWVPQRASIHKVRVRKAASATRAGDVSPTMTVKVYRWRYLSDMERVGGSKNFDDDKIVEMGGNVYRRSLVFLYSYGSFGGWDDGSAEYNLGKRCTSFQAVVGVSDTAGSSSAWYYDATTDGVLHELGTGAFGNPLPVTLNVAGVLRLQLSADRKTGDPYQSYKADGVWGRARVLCAS